MGFLKLNNIESVYKIKKRFINRYGETCEKIVSPLKETENVKKKESFLNRFFSYLLYERHEGKYIVYGHIDKIERVVNTNQKIMTIFYIENKKYITSSIIDDDMEGNIMEFYGHRKQDPEFDFAEQVVLLNKRTINNMKIRNFANHMLSLTFFLMLLVNIFAIVGVFLINGLSLISFFYAWLLTSFFPIIMGSSIYFHDKATELYLSCQDKKILEKYKNKNIDMYNISIKELQKELT